MPSRHAASPVQTVYKTGRSKQPNIEAFLSFIASPRSLGKNMSVGFLHQGIIAHQAVVDPTIELDFSVNALSKRLKHHAKEKGSCIFSPSKGLWDISRSSPDVDKSKRWPKVTAWILTKAFDGFAYGWIEQDKAAGVQGIISYHILNFVLQPFLVPQALKKKNIIPQADVVVPTPPDVPSNKGDRVQSFSAEYKLAIREFHIISGVSERKQSHAHALIVSATLNELKLQGLMKETIDLDSVIPVVPIHELFKYLFFSLECIVYVHIVMKYYVICKNVW